MDDGIGRVLDAIDDNGISENTLVLFSSDNGGALRYAQSNGALRGGKQDHWEGGIRVPTCVVWPGKIPQKRSNEIGMTMDFLPTLCEIAGVPVGAPIDGRSLVPIWFEGKQADPNRTYIWVRREGNMRYQGRAYYAIRQGPWKLLQNSPFEPMVLVNLDKDPAEANPLPNRGEVAKRLTQKLMQHLQQAGQVPWQP